MGYLSTCHSDAEVQELLEALRAQGRSREQDHAITVMLGTLRTHRLLWTGQILYDDLHSPTVIIVECDWRLSAARERDSDDLTGFTAWTCRDNFKDEAIVEGCRTLLTKPGPRFIRGTTVNVWKDIQSFFKSPALVLSPPTCTAFMAVLKHDDDLVLCEEAPGYRFRKLSAADAAVAASKWKFRRENTEIRFQTAAEAGLGAGAFTEEGDELVSWALVTEDCAIAALQTLPEHQRRNLGSKVVEMLCNEIVKLGNRPYVHIEDIETSFIPEKFFSRLGFTVVKGVERLIFSDLKWKHP